MTLWLNPEAGDMEYDCHYDARQRLQKWDVWGWTKFLPEGGTERVHDGMIVAKSGDECPIFGDEVPYKSATLLVDLDKVASLEDVIYWVGYVQGGEPSRVKYFDDNMVALRSDYHAW